MNNWEYTAWNDKSYLVENITGFDGTGGFPARNFTKGESKVREEARDYVNNVPTSSKVKYNFTVKFSTIRPFFNIRRGDYLNITYNNGCGDTFTGRVLVSSVGFSFNDGKFDYSIDFKEV